MVHNSVVVYANGHYWCYHLELPVWEKVLKNHRTTGGRLIPSFIVLNGANVITCSSLV